MENTSEAKSVLVGVLLAAGMFFLAVSGVFAQFGVPVREGALDGETDVVTCQEVSTSAWTAVPAAPMADRVGFYVTLRSSAQAHGYMISGTASAPSANINSAPIVLKPGLTQYHGWSNKKWLYVVSTGAVSSGICIEEVK